MIKRINTVGCVADTIDVAFQCTKTGGRVAIGSVVIERIPTVGRVPAAGGVAIERIKSNGRVVLAGGEAKQSIVAFSGVFAWIASVGRRDNGLRPLWKRKRAKRKENENERFDINWLVHTSFLSLFLSFV